MANAKISQLPAVTSAAGGDLAVAVASGTTSQITVDNLFKNRTMVAPTLGAATATTVNKVTITAPASGSTLTIADGKTLTASNTLTLTGTDASSVAFGTGGTVAYTANNLSVFAATTSAQLAGVISDETGSGALVFATSPTLTTPLLGTPTSGTLTNCTGLPVSTGVSGLGTGVATALGVNVGTTGSAQLFTTGIKADFESQAAAINTTGKFAGKQVWSTTDSKPVWAAGSTAGAVWVDGTGATVYTPV